MLDGVIIGVNLWQTCQSNEILDGCGGWGEGGEGWGWEVK